jgi:hypothetical protein
MRSANGKWLFSWPGLLHFCALTNRTYELALAVVEMALQFLHAQLATLTGHRAT